MKILLTNSPLNFTHGHTFTQPDWQTLILPLLASIIGQEHEIKLVDNITGVLRSNNVMNELAGFRPDLAGVSIIAGRDIYNTLKLIKAVRQKYPNLNLLAGGQGASFYDELLIQNGVNFVVRGEGEITLKELIAKLAQKADGFSDIQGISFLSDGMVKRTVNRPRIKKLDDSPFPRWDLMPLRKSRWFRSRYTASIETSRGCPFDCNFCAITSFYERSFREKSNERIVDEMKRLVRQGRSHFYFADDNFGMTINKHIALFEQILKEGLDVRFFAQMRTDTIGLHPEMIKLAAKAGLYGALIGFDTYDTETFHHVTKVGSIELNHKCVEVMRQNKIMIFGSHIYALPSQKKPFDFNKTFWVGRNKSDLFRMPHFSLLPGTKAYGKLITQEVIDSADGKEDARLFIRPPKERKWFKRWYTIFTLLNLFLPDELFKAFFHPERSVRKIKQYGYLATLRHYFYKTLRRFRFCDI